MKRSHNTSSESDASEECADAVHILILDSDSGEQRHYVVPATALGFTGLACVKRNGRASAWSSDESPNCSEEETVNRLALLGALGEDTSFERIAPHHTVEGPPGAFELWWEAVQADAAAKITPGVWAEYLRRDHPSCEKDVIPQHMRVVHFTLLEI